MRVPRPLILLANDDGVYATGLKLLRAGLLEIGDVIVCAPGSEQSAKSHSLTLHRPLRLREHEERVFSVDGTPADAVYVALHAGERVLPRQPDLIVSGLNHGVNLGDDIFYSGTVAAAREGALKGVPALAVSADLKTDRGAAVAYCVRFAQALLRERVSRPVLLNINFPPGNSWPIRATRLGTRQYRDAVEFRRDPRGQEYLWIAGSGVDHRPLAGSDTEAYDEGVVGITPLVLDLWHLDEQTLAETLVQEVAEQFSASSA